MMIPHTKTWHSQIKELTFFKRNSLRQYVSHLRIKLKVDSLLVMSPYTLKPFFFSYMLLAIVYDSMIYGSHRKYINKGRDHWHDNHYNRSSPKLNPDGILPIC